jgi:hypothetical protein
MGRLDNQPLLKTRLPSKYVDVVTIEVEIPRPHGLSRLKREPAISFLFLAHFSACAELPG